MLDLQIPYWAMTTCGGWLLGVATIVLFAAWLNRRQRAKVLEELGKIAVEFEAPEGGETDGVDQC